jgi:hypothetical protein
MQNKVVQAHKFLFCRSVFVTIDSLKRLAKRKVFEVRLKTDNYRMYGNVEDTHCLNK